MIFGKNKRKKVVRRKDHMIDVAKLQRKGRVVSPDITPPSYDVDSDGFTHVSSFSSSTKAENSPSKNTDVKDSLDSPSSMGFMDVRPSSDASFSTDSLGYSKKEVDSRIQELDRMIYRLEQRVELLEKKAGVDPGVTSKSSSPSEGSTPGLIGW